MRISALCNTESSCLITYRCFKFPFFVKVLIDKKVVSMSCVEWDSNYQSSRVIFTVEGHVYELVFVNTQVPIILLGTSRGVFNILLIIKYNS